MFKLRNPTLSALLALAPAAALADDYRFEVQGAFERGIPTDDSFDVLEHGRHCRAAGISRRYRRMAGRWPRLHSWAARAR